MTDIRDWADDADLNGEASPAGWPEGMPPSDVNNSAREMMAALRRSYVRQPWYAPGGEIVRVGDNKITIKDDTKVNNYSQYYTVGQRVRVDGAEYSTTGFVSSILYEEPTSTIEFEFDAELPLPPTINEVYVGLNYQDVQGVAGPNLLGCIIGFTDDSSKLGAGLLHANGEKFSPSLYPDLANLYLIGTESDGSPKYRYGREKVGDVWWPKRPDVRGYFPRFLDNREAPAEGEDDTRIDLGAPRTVGSIQGDDNKEHNHSIKVYTGQENSKDPVGTYMPGYNFAASAQRGLWQTQTNALNEVAIATQGSETRPKNIAVVGVIVAYGGVVAGGLADISEVLDDVKTTKELTASLSSVIENLGSVMRYCGSVATYADLPTEENEVGDVYNVLDTGANYAWTAAGTWDEFGGVIPDNVLLNNAPGDTALAIGKNASASQTAGIAIGNGAEASGTYSLAIGGTNAIASYASSTAVGSSTQALNNEATALGYGSRVLAVGATAIGGGSIDNTADHAIVIGRNTEYVTEPNTMHIAFNGTSYKMLDADGKIPVERLPEMSAYLKNTATGSGALAIGGNNIASGSNSIAIGKNAQVRANNAIQIGAGTNSVAGTVNIKTGVGVVRLLENTGKLSSEVIPDGIAPTKTSELENDSGFITADDIGGASSLEDIATAGEGITFTKPIVHNNIASGDIKGSPTISAEGLLSNLTGSNYLHLTDNSIDGYNDGVFFRGTYDWAITCKFKTPTTKTKSCLFRIEPSGNLVVWCAYNNDSTTGNIEVFLTTSSGSVPLKGATVLDLDTWYTLRLSRDTAAGQYKLELAKEGESLIVDATASSTSSLSYQYEYPIDITYVGSGMVGVTYDMKEFSVVSNYGSGINWTAYEYDTDKTEIKANVDLTGYLKNTSSSGSGLQIRGKDSNAKITMDDYNIAIGGGSSVSANSSNTQSVAIGPKAKTTDFYGVAIGYKAQAKGGVAIGDQAQTSGGASVALSGTAAYGAVSVGKYSQSSSYGVSIGYSAISSGSYSIQIGKGTNSTANTMNVGLSDSLNVQLLNSNGKIPAERLPEAITNKIWSSEPYLFNETGNLTHSGEETRGFSTSNYITLQRPFNPATNAWEVKIKFKTASATLTGDSVLLHSRRLTGSSGSRYGIYLAHSVSGTLSMGVSFDGTRYDMDLYGNTTLSASTVYWAKFGWDGSKYYIELSTDGKTFNTDGEQASSVPAYSNLTDTFIGCCNYDSVDRPMEGSLFMQDLYLGITNTNLKGTAAPTTSTVGSIGQFYVDTATGTGYMCVGVSGSAYTWKQITV